jgi:hypothetical protein
MFVCARIKERERPQFIETGSFNNFDIEVCDSFVAAFLDEPADGWRDVPSDSRYAARVVCPA